MGNVASCAPSMMISNGVAKVFTGDGRLRIYTRPVRVAELMVENPGEFVCDSSHLKVGYRIPGLSADEELELRQIYFLLPMDMLYSVLTTEEMNMLNKKASKALKQGGGGGGGSLNFTKIFPVLGLGDFCLFPNSETKTSESAEIECGEETERYSRQRSWTPALETIVEVPTPPHP